MLIKHIGKLKNDTKNAVRSIDLHADQKLESIIILNIIIECAVSVVEKVNKNILNVN